MTRRPARGLRRRACTSQATAASRRHSRRRTDRLGGINSWIAQSLLPSRITACKTRGLFLRTRTVPSTRRRRRCPPATCCWPGEIPVPRDGEHPGLRHMLESGAQNATACDTGNPCTQNDACQGGVCLSGKAPDCQAPAWSGAAVLYKINDVVTYDGIVYRNLRVHTSTPLLTPPTHPLFWMALARGHWRPRVLRHGSETAPCTSSVIWSVQRAYLQAIAAARVDARR